MKDLFERHLTLRRQNIIELLEEEDWAIPIVVTDIIIGTQHNIESTLSGVKCVLLLSSDVIHNRSCMNG